MVKVTFAVRENNMDTIRKIALDVSDPNSPNYGRYLTQTQIDEITAPAAADVAAVRSWLVPSLRQSDCAGLDQHDCEFHLPQFHLGRPPRRPPPGAAAAVGSLLNTEFRRVLNAATGQSALRAGSFALPAGAAAAITAVFGVHGLPLPPKRNQVTAVTPGQPALVTPTVIETTYGVAGVTVDRASKNRQAVAEFHGQTMNR